jgi:hypothetical protein
VKDFVAAMRSGAKFPPLAAFEIDGQFVLADGFHRLEAARTLGRKSIALRLTAGTRAEAIRFALTANQTHGARRTNRDKQRAAEVAIREFAGLSDRALGELCGTSDRFISRVRKQRGANGSHLVRTGLDGKMYPVCPEPRATGVGTTPSERIEPDFDCFRRRLLELVSAVSTLANEYPTFQPILLGRFRTALVAIKASSSADPQAPVSDKPTTNIPHDL